MRCRTVVPLLFVLTALVSSACSLGEKSITATQSQVVVHAVLDPGALFQEVLVERLLTGLVQINKSQRFDPLDPINTGDGVPVAGALVSITGPDGTMIGLEQKYQNKPATYGTGRYIIQAGFKALKPIRPGARYILTVRTPEGTTVTGTTLIPNIAPFIPTTKLDVFDRSRDTLRLGWQAVAGARTYGLRVESPFGAFLLFNDSTRYQLAGGMRNLYADDLQRLFIPGFRQVSTVFAVDTNYFDYYRSRNDPFTGSGIINRLEGGTGLFGAAVTIDSRTLDVTQQPVEPAFEGNYEFVRTSSQTPPLIDVLRLYIETAGTTGASISGWYSPNRATTLHDGIVGARDGTRIELQFQVNQDPHQTLARFIGTQVGDSLVGTYTGSTDRVVFKRLP